MARHIKKGDTVKIISGDHKGATGRILHVYPDKRKVVVQGHNMVKKHVRPSQKNPQGGRIDVEQPMDISNVLPVNPKTSETTRVRYELQQNGTKKRVSLDGSQISIVKRAKTKN